MSASSRRFAFGWPSRFLEFMSFGSWCERTTMSPHQTAFNLRGRSRYYTDSSSCSSARSWRECMTTSFYQSSFHKKDRSTLYSRHRPVVIFVFLFTSHTAYFFVMLIKWRECTTMSSHHLLLVVNSDRSAVAVLPTCSSLLGALVHDNVVSSINLDIYRSFFVSFCHHNPIASCVSWAFICLVTSLWGWRPCGLITSVEGAGHAARCSTRWDGECRVRWCLLKFASPFFYGMHGKKLICFNQNDGTGMTAAKFVYIVLEQRLMYINDDSRKYWYFPPSCRERRLLRTETIVTWE